MTALLDVNLLLILHDPFHPHYSLVDIWFRKTGSKTYATCPITQSGFIRLLTCGIPGLRSFTMREARSALENFVQLPGHVYWPDDPAYLDATKKIFPRVQGYRQITDAYLLGLAIHHRARLATLDRGILHLAGRDFAGNVEVIE